MGILNVTEDSFYANSRVMDADDILNRANKMLKEAVFEKKQNSNPLFYAAWSQ